jgi:hypothetical protein
VTAFLLAGCGDDEPAATTGASGTTSGSGGAGGAVDPDDPCATLVAPRVAWVTEGDPEITLTVVNDDAFTTVVTYRSSRPQGLPDSELSIGRFGCAALRSGRPCRAQTTEEAT